MAQGDYDFGTKFKNLAFGFATMLTVAAASPAQDSNADAQIVLNPVTDQKINSPQEDLRRKLFKTTINKASCATISTDPRGNLQAVDAELESFIKLLLTSLKNKNAKALQPLFHKRLAISQEAVGQTLNKLGAMFGTPYDASIYRVWGLNTVDGSPKGLSCDDDRLVVYPQYGYPLEIGLWLQIQGPQELGRLFVTLVPADGRWNIGAFHAQQWTHSGKDFATWAEDAQKASYMGDKEVAYILYDIATKLLNAGGHIDFALRDDLVKTQQAIITTSNWEKSLRVQLKDWDVVYLSSLLVVDGAGLLVRLRFAQEISVDTMKAECAKILGVLAKNPWHMRLSGVRCSFLLPKEDAMKEGALGGIYLEFPDK